MEAHPRTTSPLYLRSRRPFHEAPDLPLCVAHVYMLFSSSGVGCASLNPPAPCSCRRLFHARHWIHQVHRGIKRPSVRIVYLDHDAYVWPNIRNSSGCSNVPMARMIQSGIGHQGRVATWNPSCRLRVGPENLQGKDGFVGLCQKHNVKVRSNNQATSLLPSRHHVLQPIPQRSRARRAR